MWEGCWEWEGKARVLDPKPDAGLSFLIFVSL